MALPSGYTQLEYIQSTGTQHINTSFIPDTNTRVVCDFQLTSAGATNQCIFGVVGQFSFRWFGSNSVFRANGQNSVDFPAGIPALDRHAADKTATACTIDGAYSVTTTAATSISYPLFIFAQNASGSASNYAQLKLYSFQAYSGAALVRVYIPCKNDSGVVGLWDAVNSVFYANAGTGVFTAGPEVPVAAVPDTPANFRQTAATVTTISLEWDAVDCDGYKLYRDTILISTQPGTAYTDTVPRFSACRYWVTAYNSDGESEPALLIGAAAYPGFEVITTRGPGAFYGPIDLNRVEGSAAYLTAYINALPGALLAYLAGLRVAPDVLFEVPYTFPVTTDPKTDWTAADIIAPDVRDETARCLDNVVTLRAVLTLPPGTPAVPGDMDYLTYAEANDIEAVLVAVHTALLAVEATKKALADRTPLGWWACAEVTCGGY